MDIKILGAHSRESLQTRMISILVDNNLVIDAGGLTSGLSMADQLRIKAVLITHSHYDHIRDIPAFGRNFLLNGASFDLYSTQQTLDVITGYLLDGKIYPNFHEYPPGNPTIRLNVIEQLKPFRTEGYGILAVPVKHSVLTVGYQITSPDDKVVFYTSDTGQDLADCWEQVSPQLLIIEVTNSNRLEEKGHLTPNLLKQELMVFQKMKGYLPEVVTVHMNPPMDEEIKEEIAVVAEELGCPITVGYEGMKLHL